MANIPNILIQPYRGALGSREHDELQHYLRTIHGYGLPAILFHGFPQELHGNWDKLATLAQSEGVQAGAAWGIDSNMPGTQKGALIGDVLADARCALGMLDGEGAYDSDKGPADFTDEQNALALGEELRRRAPRAAVGDQAWFAIESHGDLRPVPLAYDKGGVFRGFPVDEFSVKAVNLGHFRQAYCNDFVAQFGDDRYAKVFAWMDRDWAKITPALRAAGLERPLGVTIQGYGWRLRDLTHCLLDRCVRPDMPLAVWSEPKPGWPHAFPTPDTMAGIQFAIFMCHQGFGKIGADPRDMVRAFQTAHNALAPSDKQLDVDGWAGPKTIAAAGIQLAPSLPAKPAVRAYARASGDAPPAAPAAPLASTLPPPPTEDATSEAAVDDADPEGEPDGAEVHGNDPTGEGTHDEKLTARRPGRKKRRH